MSGLYMLYDSFVSRISFKKSSALTELSLCHAFFSDCSGVATVASREKSPKVIPRNPTNVSFGSKADMSGIEIRAAVHLDLGGDKSRDHWPEMAAVHGQLLIRACLRFRRPDLLDGSRAGCKRSG